MRLRKVEETEFEKETEKPVLLETEMSIPIGIIDATEDQRPDSSRAISIKKNPKMQQDDRRSSDSVIPRKAISSSSNKIGNVNTRATSPGGSPKKITASISVTHVHTSNSANAGGKYGSKKQSNRNSEKLPPRAMTLKKGSATRCATMSEDTEKKKMGKQLSEKAQAEIDAILAMLGET